METLLHDVARFCATVIELIAIVIIVFGTVQAIVLLARTPRQALASGERLRTVWLAFARWLIAGLTFQLAADLVNTSFNPTWDELGQLAAIAAIRTFLSFFLDREVEYTRRLQHPGAAE